MSFAHMLILGVIALIVIPPEKLPEVARQVAKFIYDLKRSADQIMGDLKQEAIFKPGDIIDQNIKDKLAQIQKDLNQSVNFNDVIKPHDGVAPASTPPVAQAPITSPVTATDVSPAASIAVNEVKKNDGQ